MPETSPPSGGIRLALRKKSHLVRAPIAWFRYESSKIVGVIISDVKHHVDDCVLKRDCHFPHIISAKLSCPQKIQITQSPGLLVVNIRKGGQALYGDA